VLGGDRPGKKAGFSHAASRHLACEEVPGLGAAVYDGTGIQGLYRGLEKADVAHAERCIAQSNTLTERTPSGNEATFGTRFRWRKVNR